MSQDNYINNIEKDINNYYRIKEIALMLVLFLTKISI